MKEGDSLAEIIKVEPVVDTFIHRSLLRFNLSMRNFHQGKSSILVKNHGDSTLSNALVNNCCLIPASIDLCKDLRARSNPGEPIPSAYDCKQSENDLFVLELNILPSLGFEKLKSVVDYAFNLLLSKLLLKFILISLFLLKLLEGLVAL